MSDLRAGRWSLDSLAHPTRVHQDALHPVLLTTCAEPGLGGLLASAERTGIWV